MEKAARKALEKQLVTNWLTELIKTNEKAAHNTMKHLKDAGKTIAKKFAKAVVALQKEKAAAIARQPLMVKSTALKTKVKTARKAIPKTVKKVSRKRK